MEGILIFGLVVFIIIGLGIMSSIDNIYSELSALNKRMENNTDRSGTFYVGTTKVVDQ